MLQADLSVNKMNCKTTEGTKNVLKRSYVKHTAKIGDSENRM